MADKNLPIKFFQKRQKDAFDNEAAGGGDMPAWASQEIAVQKSAYVKQVLSGISDTLDRKRKTNNYTPSVIKVKMNQDALAKSYRKDIGNLFNINELNIIGVNGIDELLIKVNDEQVLQAIIKNLDRVNIAFPSNSTVVGISAISDIEAFVPEIILEKGKETEVFKIKLFNYGNMDLNGILLRTFEKFCHDNKLECQRTSYSAELNIYSVNGVTADTLEELKNFDGVQMISEMPVYNLDMEEISEDHEIVVKLPKKDVEYPIVGVLDTGIAKIPHLAPWLHTDSLTYYVEEDTNKGHGTFVAGVMIYGDELEGKDYTGFDGCKLFEAIVMPDLKKQKLYEYELIEQIRDSISRNNHIKIWNLSLGTDVEADLNEFSDFAKALDEIQDEHDVLICKSAGNCDNFQINAPKRRISKSADTVRALVVGSITHDKNATDHAEKFNPSPFSRIGPGPAHLIKPDLAHMGGNAGTDVRNRIVKNPVKSFAVDGRIARQVGTSFSTPRISAIAAGLNSILNEKFNAILIKALMIHSAKYPIEMKMGIADKLNSVGFGMPSSIGDILFNEPNEITLILQDTIEKGNYVDILDFPFPKSMIDDEGYFYGEITVTLVTSPILEVSQGAEYCQSNIDVFLGTYDQKVEKDTTLPRIKNPIGAEGRQNLLSTAVYSKRAGKNMDIPFASERMLISYSDKYQPVKKWCVNLDEFTESNKDKFLKAPKNWYLKVKGLFREFTESKAEAQKVTPNMDFCLVITIKDTKKKGNIYNEVTQLLDNYSFVHSNVKVREEVRLRLNNG
ncbi:S8 family peptidase [Cytophagaceae bacterium 50C-KIRBA]|uniref:S8 family peptidase n=1 Tax=Aquirufa beregesia TaxID=2516556 RepID=A0ABX0EVD7_9BACT|nr:S8 family peptidase [Aquirufa beregesia]NGZ44530.1 S8 family peptidase [Aquirufa beregesia]